MCDAGKDEIGLVDRVYPDHCACDLGSRCMSKSDKASKLKKASVNPPSTRDCSSEVVSCFLVCIAYAHRLPQATT